MIPAVLAVVATELGLAGARAAWDALVGPAREDEPFPFAPVGSWVALDGSSGVYGEPPGHTDGVAREYRDALRLVDAMVEAASSCAPSSALQVDAGRRALLRLLNAGVYVRRYSGALALREGETYQQVESERPTRGQVAEAFAGFGRLLDSVCQRSAVTVAADAGGGASPAPSWAPSSSSPWVWGGLAVLCAAFVWRWAYGR